MKCKMSLLPLLLDLDDMYNDRVAHRRYYRPSFDHHFGLGIHPEQLQAILLAPNRLRQSLSELEKQVGVPNKSDVSAVGKDGFQVCLDVQQFKPSEVSVKVIDNAVVIEGKHEERQDEHGYIARHFTRKYLLPKEVDAAQLASTLSSDGILTVKAPLTKPAVESNERVIQVQQTGPARNSVKENQTEQAEKK